MFTGETVSENSGTPALAGEMLVAMEDVTKRYAQRVAVEKITLSHRVGEVPSLGCCASLLSGNHSVWLSSYYCCWSS